MTSQLCIISVSSPEYKTDFFKQFDIVLNALDNRGKYVIVKFRAR